MNDIELLKGQIRKNPDDDTLLCMYIDELLSLGRYQEAELATEYRDRLRLMRIPNYAHPSKEDAHHLLGMDRLGFVLGFRDIQVGDYIYSDRDGRAYPSTRRYRDSVGRAVKGEAEGRVQVWLFGGSPWADLVTTVEVSRM